MSHYTSSVPDTLRAPNWRADAACKADPEAMYDGSEHGIEYAKAICYRCPVMEHCGQEALTNREPHGTWGGLSEQDRRKILRRRGMKLPDVDDEDEPRPKRTLQTLYDQRTVALHDGHLAWTGAVPVHCNGHYYTPTQIAFQVDRGRPPQGIIRRTCDRDGCVLPAHLMDQREREQSRQQQAVSA